MSKPTYERVNWKSGTLVTPAHVNEDGTIQEAVYQCDTPMTPANLNKMDKGISDIYEYGVTSNEIAISNIQPTNEDALIWINTDGTIKFKNEDGEWQDTSSSGGENEIIGSAKLFFGNTEPNGYKFLNGQAISRTEYAELFNLIGTTYGEGDGSTTFNLPDMSGRVPVGLNVNKEWFNALGKTGGAEEVTLTIEQMPEHNHNIKGQHPFASGDKEWVVQPCNTATPSQKSNTAIESTGGGQAHNNLQPYITVNYIIKVKNVASEQTIVPDYTPIGTVTDFDGDVVPEGWEEVEEEKDVYSTDEVKTNKVWIDGKPIYRKVIEYTTPASSQYPSISISNLDFDTIYFAEGSVSIRENRYIGADSNQYMSRYIDKQSKKISFINDEGKAIHTVNVLEYTKTTDEVSTNEN